MDRPRSLTIENGGKAAPTFSQGEMSGRLRRLRAHMATADIDAVLFTSIQNINYFTDFVYCSFGRSYGLVVTQDRSTTISANIDGGQPWRQSFGDQLVYTDWQRDNYFAAVKELTPRARRVGVEVDQGELEVPLEVVGVVPAPTAELEQAAGSSRRELLQGVAVQRRFLGVVLDRGHQPPPARL